jgi:hypothetical protein
VTGCDRDGCGGRRVRAARIEQHGYPHRPEEALPHRSEDLLAAVHAAAPDENRGALQRIPAARENRAVDEVAHSARLHAAVGEHVLRASVHRHDPVEDAGVRVAVELDQDLRLLAHEDLAGVGPVGDEARPHLAAAEGYAPMNGCFALSFPAIIVSALGSPFIARAIDSLVAS